MHDTCTYDIRTCTIANSYVASITYQLSSMSYIYNLGIRYTISISKFERKLNPLSQIGKLYYVVLHLNPTMHGWKTSKIASSAILLVHHLPRHLVHQIFRNGSFFAIC